MTRRRYLIMGVSLMALKYAGDFLLVGVATGRIWTLFDYVGSLVFAVSPKLNDAPTWLLWAMGVWVLPFVLVGVRFTMARAIDAGWTPWIALCFFVPIGNYALMTALCLAPSVVPASTFVGEPEPPRVGSRAAFFIAAVAGGLLGPLMVGLTVYVLGTYGTAMFLGTPFVMGTVSGYVLARLQPGTEESEAVFAGLLAIVVVAVSFLAFAIEGLLCLLMALPLAVPLVIFGAHMGLSIARRGGRDIRPMMFGLLALPLAAVMEPSPGAAPVAREVFSSIEIAATPEMVWPHVVAFSDAQPTDWLSRSGIAYPKSARIVGSGVGAVRYCEFSTGAFVEPISAWQPGIRLAFDVTASPPPLRELSVYPGVHPPHLDGFLRSRRGEFRLVALPGGRTRLEGRTWYEIDMAPEWYWRVFGDWMIHRIHERVLDHIKGETTSRR